MNFYPYIQVWEGGANQEGAGVGQVMLRKAPLLHLFSSYALTHHYASRQLTGGADEKGVNPGTLKGVYGEHDHANDCKFSSECLFTFERNPACKGRNLVFFLDIPLQAVSRYQTFVTQFDELTPASHCDKELLAAARAAIAVEVQHINDAFVQADLSEKLAKLEAQFSSTIDLQAPKRTILHTRELMRQTRHGNRPYTFHLLSDLLLYSEPNSAGKLVLHRRLPLSEIVITPMNETGIQISSSEKSFVIIFPDPSTQNTWLRCILERQVSWLACFIKYPLRFLSGFLFSISFFCFSVSLLISI
jgi:hypothetical protein